MSSNSENPLAGGASNSASQPLVGGHSFASTPPPQVGGQSLSLGNLPTTNNPPLTGSYMIKDVEERRVAESFMGTVTNLVKDGCEDALYLEFKFLSEELSKCCTVFGSYLTDAIKEKEPAAKKVWPYWEAWSTFIGNYVFTAVHQFISVPSHRSRFYDCPLNLVMTGARGKPQYSSANFNADKIITRRGSKNSTSSTASENNANSNPVNGFALESLTNNMLNDDISDGGPCFSQPTTGTLDGAPFEFRAKSVSEPGSSDSGIVQLRKSSKRAASQNLSDSQPPVQCRAVTSDPSSDSDLIKAMTKLLDSRFTDLGALKKNCYVNILQKNLG